MMVLKAGDRKASLLRSPHSGTQTLAEPTATVENSQVRSKLTAYLAEHVHDFNPWLVKIALQFVDVMERIGGQLTYEDLGDGASVKLADDQITRIVLKHDGWAGIVLRHGGRIENRFSFEMTQASYDKIEAELAKGWESAQELKKLFREESFAPVWNLG